MGSEHREKRRTGQLFIVATPIGNLGDITYRAVESLKQVDLIAAEDTRVSRKLLSHYGIATPVVACHEHNEREMADTLIRRLQAGEDVALISDAGTPLINDPGYRLVSRVRESGIDVSPLPGASSPIAALSACGLPTDSFTYHGFLPRSGRHRKEMLAHVGHSSFTQVIMESPRRLVGTLRDLQDACGSDRRICVARELTKLHEEFISGSIAEVMEQLRDTHVRGEIVLVIEGSREPPAPTDDATILQRLADEEMQQLAPSARARRVAQEFRLPRSRVYDLLLTQGTDKK